MKSPPLGKNGILKQILEWIERTKYKKSKFMVIFVGTRVIIISYLKMAKEILP